VKLAKRVRKEASGAKAAARADDEQEQTARAEQAAMMEKLHQLAMEEAASLRPWVVGRDIGPRRPHGPREAAEVVRLSKLLRAEQPRVVSEEDIGPRGPCREPSGPYGPYKPTPPHRPRAYGPLEATEAAKISKLQRAEQPRVVSPSPTTAERAWPSNWRVKVQGHVPRCSDEGKRPRQQTGVRKVGSARGMIQQAAAGNRPQQAEPQSLTHNSQHVGEAPRPAPRTDNYDGCRPDLWEDFVDGDVRLRRGLSMVFYVVGFRPLGDGNCGQRAVVHDEVGGLGYEHLTGDAAIAGDLAAAMDLKLRGVALLAEAMNKEHALVFKLALRDDKTVTVKGQTFTNLTRHQYLARMGASIVGHVHDDGSADATTHYRSRGATS
jgi:hypothetical protein